MKPLSFTWTVEERADGKLLREFLLEDQSISRRFLTDIKFKGGKLLLNNEAVTVRKQVEVGDEVTVIFPEETRSERMKPIPLPLHISYEDDHFLVIDKPPYLATIPSRNEPDRSLAQAVLYHYERNGIRSAIHTVTRLDRNTSGLVLIAKHRYAHSLLSKQQIDYEVKRIYTAVVHGKIEIDRGTICKPIARKSDSIIERTVSRDGQRAITHFQVLHRCCDKTVVNVSLETGRTHQIRVHFASLGFPIVGDELYGGKQMEIERQALHSTELAFYHPFLKKEVTFHAPLPKDLLQLI